MRTPQLTEQYGQVDRVSVARAILSSLSCATAGVRSNPRREKPAPPASAPLRKVLRENSIASSDYFDLSRADCTPNFAETIIPPLRRSQSGKPHAAIRVYFRRRDPIQSMRADILTSA